MSWLEDTLPVCIMTASFISSVIYMCTARYGSALYWFSAGLLNFAVIFMIKRLG